MSKPEPGRCVVRGSIRDYSRRSPEPPGIALVVEISDTSLIEDRKQGIVYAGGGISVFWTANLVARQAEVCTYPRAVRIRVPSDFPAGQEVPIVIDDQQCGAIAVDDILP
jgi:hypothetical protein